MYLSQLNKKYRIGWIHNEKEFRSDSFWIEDIGNKKVLMGRNKRNQKNPGQIRRAAILKPLPDIKIW